MSGPGGRGQPLEPARARSGDGDPTAARSGPKAAPRGLLPAIELPKGGGAIRGIGEKLAANPATGTASLAIPLATSPGRAGFAVALSLSYDSGSGNGPFGLGWHLSIAAITRKTDKGLPRYRDDEPDVFVLSGAEDLVRVQGTDAAFDRGAHRVVRYRPRTEGLFARIEQWTERATGDVHWRATTRDNVTSIYGERAGARIADPDDARRVFSWLLEETRDDRGNIAQYEYLAENDDGVDRGRACEAHRITADGSFRAGAQRYPKRVRYGNRAPGVAADWMFEVVFDYGEHGALAPAPADAAPWPVRADAFSSYRAGFEVRTYRLCRRVLMFHHFAELGATACLVRSTDLAYEEGPSATYLRGVTHAGYLRSANGYERAAVPALELDYARPAIHDELEWLDRASLEGLPGGVGDGMHWIDLEGEGLPGVLHTGERGWSYKRNLGGGLLTAPALLRSLPVPAALGAQQLVDLDGDGRLELAQYAAPLAGYFARTADGDWAPFVALREVPNLDWNDPNLRFVDLDGDGHADVLITEDDAVVWYRSRGADGFAAPAVVAGPRDEARGPAVVFATGVETIHLADLSGDGLVDLVRVRNGEVCYWPNLGHGRFGSKVTVEHAPLFDAADLFDARRVRFADLDGSGTSDLFYMRRDGVDVYWNLAGNRLSAPRRISSLPPVDTLASVTVVDLLGQGTSCLVWSSPAGAVAYVDLMGGVKPHLLASVDNGLGGETRITYAPSTRFYLADRAAGRPWLTRLPFPVHVVERIEQRDRIAGSTLVTRYAYHHGFFDGVEREFRGFAFVEQWDAEAFTGVEELAPTHTKTWFHTGAWLERERLELGLAREYYDRDPLAPVVPATILPAGLTVREEREAIRALRGLVLRQEIFADDRTPASVHPYAVTEHAYEVRLVQPASGDGDGRVPAVCFAHPRHTIALHYERRPDDPRTTFEIVLEVDEFGTVTAQAAIAAPRRAPAEPEQARGWATVTERRFAHRPAEDDWYRIGVPYEETTIELTGFAPGAVPTVAAIRAALAAAPEVPFEAPAGGGVPGRRVIAHARHLYYDQAAAAALPLGEIASHALPYESYRLALTSALVAAVYGARVDDALLRDDGRYVRWDGGWWAPSGQIVYDAAHFYLPVRAIDPFGGIHAVTYDAHQLLIVDAEDPVGNHVAAAVDYRVLGPVLVTDPNGNRVATRHDALGLVVATAVMGKDGEGSTLDEPTTRFEYDLHAWRARGEPAFAHLIAREAYRGPSRLQHSYHYTDGSGREAMIKAQAEPGEVAGGLWASPRWVGTGRTVFDNKGNPVKKYEPYFSATPAYEDEPALVESGVTAILRYDPLGRLVRTDLPDGTHARVAFDAWRQETWDPCDTIAGTPWLTARQAGTASQRRCAALALAHAGTPTVAHVDALGRAFLAIADNGARGTLATRTALDVAGAIRLVTDARGRVVVTHAIDLLGRPIHVIGADAGESRVLLDVGDKPRTRWDHDGAADWRSTRLEYDVAQRPTHVYEGARLVERVSYGEHHGEAEARNLRGRAYQSYDGAGVATAARFDFAGNPIESGRRLAAAYDAAPDWSALAAAALTPAEIEASAEALIDPERFTTTSTFDALGRAVSTITPDGSETRPTYNDAGLLETVAVRVRGAAAWTTFVAGVDYDARGQRRSIAYGDGGTTAQTRYAYDPATFRLIGMWTTSAGGVARQALTYEHDPAGNIVEIVDGVSYGNPGVRADGRYEYDALYQLVSAEGREHPGQQPGPGETERHANDLQGLRRYRETYAYDDVGNFESVTHDALDGSGARWVREYEYVPGTNRLAGTSAEGDLPGVRSLSYAHDAAGNMTSMPHLRELRWDARDRLVHARIDPDPASADAVYFAYDAAGQRVRKVYRHGAYLEERIYLGGYEVYRKRRTAAGADPTPVEARETLHVTDGARRIALVETKGTTRIRFQLDNHLGSSVMELAPSGADIGYEEYFPYGGTAWVLPSGDAEVSARRYRYTGKERDDETGLYYYGARYYAAWLGRWTSADPAGFVDGPNVYQYACGGPVSASDLDGMQTTQVLTEEPTTEQVAEFQGPFQDENGDYYVVDAQGNRWASGAPMVVVAPSEEESFWESAGKAVRDFAVGALHGVLESMFPVMPAPPFDSAAFSVGRGIGGVIMGLAEVTGSIALGGAALASLGVDVGIGAIAVVSVAPALVTVVAAGAVVTAIGLGVLGASTTFNAMAKVTSKPREGGSHKDVKKGSKQGEWESNHTPPKSVIPEIDPEIAPAHRMGYGDHRVFDSTISKAYNETLKDIKRYRGTAETQLADIQRIIDRTGMRYKKGLYEAILKLEQILAKKGGGGKGSRAAQK